MIFKENLERINHEIDYFKAIFDHEIIEIKKELQEALNHQDFQGKFSKEVKDDHDKKKNDENELHGDGFREMFETCQFWGEVHSNSKSKVIVNHNYIVPPLQINQNCNSLVETRCNDFMKKWSNISDHVTYPATQAGPCHIKICLITTLIPKCNVPSFH
jgi:hypothetical protein